MACGKIVCKLEAERCGVEFCPFCSAWLLEEPRPSESQRRATEHKDKLVAFDREGAKRTRVLDDHTDWFSEAENVWRSRDERAEAARRAVAQEEELKLKRRQMKIRLNFDRPLVQGVVELVDNAPEIEAFQAREKEDLDRHISDHTTTRNGNQLSTDSLAILDEIFANISDFRPLHSAFSLPPTATHRLSQHRSQGLAEENLDPEISAPTKPIPVVSLPQPEASLAAFGFKRVIEGEISDHRVWIRADTRPPSEARIAQVLHFYAALYASAGLPTPGFPAAFPTGCLLGLVEISDSPAVSSTNSILEARDAALHGKFPILEQTGGHAAVKKACHLILPHKFPTHAAFLSEGDAKLLWDSLVPSVWPKPDAWIPEISRFSHFQAASSISLDQAATVEVLEPALVLLRSSLGISDQRSLLGRVARLAKNEAPFYRQRVFPDDRKFLTDPNALFNKDPEMAEYARTCLGFFWDGRSRKFVDRRVHVDDMSVAGVPSDLIDFFLATAISVSHKVRFCVASETPVCDFVVLDYHAKSMGDFVEEFPTHSQFPTLRLALNRGCIFSYRSKSGDERTVELQPGDAVISGPGAIAEWRLSLELPTASGLADSGAVLLTLGSK